MRRKPGRPRAGEEVLSREIILTAALTLVDQEGVQALTMRRLARVLDVDPMALYRHVPDKYAVLAGLVERVFGELEVPPDRNMTWQERLRTFASAYYQLAETHPNLVLYLVTDAAAGARAALAASEYLYAALIDAGLAPTAILRAADLVVDALNGYALAAQSGRLGQPHERREFLDLLRQAPVRAYPAMRTVFGQLNEETIRADMAAEFEILVAGIEAMAATHSLQETQSRQPWQGEVTDEKSS